MVVGEVSFKGGWCFRELREMPGSSRRGVRSRTNLSPNYNLNFGNTQFMYSNDIFLFHIDLFLFRVRSFLEEKEHGKRQAYMRDTSR